MTVLRELVARLGFQVDNASFKQAEAGVARVTQAMRNIGDRLAGARGAAKGDANEMQRVVEQEKGANYGL